MLNKKKSLIAAIALFAASGSLLAGTTFAWYQMNQTASLNLNGASVGGENSLKLGLYTSSATISELTKTEQEAKGLYKDATLDNVYWVANDISKTTLNYVVEQDGYNPTELEPVTTEAHELEASYSIKGSYNNSGVIQAADKTSYTEFTLVFKTIDAKGDKLASKDIYFDATTFTTQKVTVGDTEVDLGNALRLGFQGKHDGFGTVNSDVIGVKATTAGSHRASGRLDLNANGCWDVDETTSKEIYYGTGSVEPTYLSTATVDGGVRKPFDPILNKFDTSVSENGYYAVDYESDGHVVDSVANYNVFSKYTKGTENAKSIATTNSDGLAYVTFDLFLEGWDHSCINSIIDLTYAANINFVADIAE